MRALGLVMGERDGKKRRAIETSREQGDRGGGHDEREGPR